MDGSMQVNFSFPCPCHRFIFDFLTLTDLCYITYCIYHWIQPALGADGKKVETQSNVLLALIENMQYAVTVDVLHTVRDNNSMHVICFSACLNMSKLTLSFAFIGLFSVWDCPEDCYI